MSGIVKASAALKSTYQLGLEAEELVLQAFQKRGFRLYRRRWRTPFAEVDLALQGKSPRDLLLIEVKRQSSSEFRAHLLSIRQRQRLGRVVLWLSEFGYQTQLTFVVVDQAGRIEEIPEVFVDAPAFFRNPILK